MTGKIEWERGARNEPILPNSCTRNRYKRPPNPSYFFKNTVTKSYQYSTCLTMKADESADYRWIVF